MPHFEQYRTATPAPWRGSTWPLPAAVATPARPGHAGGTLDRRFRVALLRGQLGVDEANRTRRWPGCDKQATAPYEAETNAALAAVLRALHRDQEAEKYTQAAQQLRADQVRMVDIARAMLSGENAAALRFEAGTIMRRRGREPSAVHWFASAYILDRNDPATRRALAESLHKSDELTAEDWLTAFTDWGAQGYFGEADFSTALALYRRALQEAAADPAFEPPASFLPELPPGQRRNRWRQTRSFPQVEAAWEWLAEMHCRMTDNLPSLTEAEFASLARWFQENDSRLAQSEPSATLADLRAGLLRGPRAGAGKWAGTCVALCPTPVRVVSCVCQTSCDAEPRPIPLSPVSGRGSGDGDSILAEMCCYSTDSSPLTPPLSPKRGESNCAAKVLRHNEMSHPRRLLGFGSCLLLLLMRPPGLPAGGADRRTGRQEEPPGSSMSPTRWACISSTTRPDRVYSCRKSWVLAVLSSTRTTAPSSTCSERRSRVEIGQSRLYRLSPQGSFRTSRKVPAWAWPEQAWAWRSAM